MSDMKNAPLFKEGFSIGRFSVTRPVLVNILMIALLALGVFSVVQLPQEQFAEVPFFWVNIIVPYPGVSAEDMETTVTIPIENQFQGINRLRRISSTTSEGLSVVRIEFDDGISNDEFRSLYQESQTRFSQVQLPDGVLTPVIDDFSSADFLPVIEVVLSGDVSYSELRQEARLLRDRLLRVRDVSDVDIVGAPDRQIILDTDPRRLAALGMTPTEVLRAVQDQNQAIPGGTLKTGTREYLLRTLGSVSSVEDFSQVIVRRSEESGGMVRVSDIASVVDGSNPNSPISRYDGERAVSLRVTKVPRGSSVTVVNGTRAIVEQLESQLPPGMKINLFNDSTVQIASSLAVLTSNAFLGLLLLLVILWLFIGFRNALITALGVPITFALTFLILDLLGETINTNTLFGLVLVLGLIVDHAIVIIENSYRLRQQGLSRHDAAIAGTNQVVLPVIAATATTIAAFLPLMLIPGTIGRFLRVIPLTVTIALIASTGEALFFLPSHFADWGKEKQRKRPPGWWFKIFRKRYERRISSLYNHKKKVLLTVLAVSAVVFSLTGTLRQDLFSAEDFSYFSIDITMPVGTPLDRTDEIVSEFEQVILSLKDQGEISSIRSSIGTATGGAGSTTNSNIAQITVDLFEQDEGRLRSIDEIIEEVQWAAYYIAGPEQVLYRKAQNGPPTSAPISYRISGDDISQLQGASAEIRTLLEGFAGVTNIEDDFTPGSPELQVRIDQERATAFGLDTAQIGNFIRARFDGLPVGTFFLNNEEIDVVLRFDDGAPGDFIQLEQSVIPTPDGRLIPFSSVAHIVQDTSLGSISRVDGRRELTLTADASDQVDLGEVDRAVSALWDDQISARFPGAEFQSGGEFSEFQDLLIDILRIFTLGVFLIYLILGTQFNSYSQPFLILLSVPFAFVGVILFLAVTGTPLSTTVIYAGVALAGIAVNDAIVLISFINQRRKDGMPVRKAVIAGASTRLRPIVLTSLTTIMGLLPTAVGIGGTSVVWGPMASTIIFGLVFSTITTLVVIPMLYGLIYDRKASEKTEPARQRALLPAAKPLLIIAAAGIMLVSAPGAEAADAAFVPGYPDLMCCVTGERLSEAQVDIPVLEEFFMQWTESSESRREMTMSSSSPMLSELLLQNSPTLGQLQSVYRIQQASLADLQARARPSVSIQNPSVQNPLYGYRRDPDPLPQQPDQAHSFNIGAAVAQQLPTAGSVRMEFTHQSSMSETGGSWAWNMNPVLTASIEQPLLLGPGIIRTDHMSSRRQQEEIALDGALDSLTRTRDQLVLQSLRLLHLRQTLMENRYTAHEQLKLLTEDIDDAQENIERGLISRSDYRRLLLQKDQQLLNISEVNKEIMSVEASLEQLYGSSEVYAGQILLPDASVNDAVQRFTGRPLTDDDEIRSRMLSADPDYRDARRELRSAELDRLIGNPSDAPRLGASLRLEAPEGNTFEDSYGKLFSTDAVLSVAVTMQIPDLFRRSSRFTSSVVDQQIRQAEMKVDEAVLSVDLRIAEIQAEIDNLLFSLSVLLEEYELFRQDREDEQLRFSSGLSDSSAMRRVILAEEAAAFRVLQVLREIEIISIELENMIKI